MTDDSEEIFSIPTFLEENSRLFTVLSVFGAISIYFSQFPTSNAGQWQNIGVVSGLILFLITALSIRSRLKEELASSIFDYITKPRKDSYKLALFVVPFYLLVVTVSTLVVQYSAATVFVLQLVVIAVGISTMIWAVGAFEFVLGYPDELGVVGYDERIVVFSKYMFLISSLGLAVSGAALWHLSGKYGYGIHSILQMRVGPGVVPLLYAYFVGVILGSGLYIFLAGSVYILHRMIELLEAKGLFEMTAFMYRKHKDIDEPEQSELDDFEDKNDGDEEDSRR